MYLPIYNRSIALTRFLGIEIVLIILCLVFYGDIILNNNFLQKYWPVILVVNFIIFGLVLYLNNLKSGKLENEEILLNFNGRSKIIPINSIKSITAASNRGDIFKGTYSKSFFIKLDKRYLFGSQLILTYNDLRSIEDEPIAIKIIKSIKPALNQN